MIETKELDDYSYWFVFDFKLINWFCEWYCRGCLFE